MLVWSCGKCAHSESPENSKIEKKWTEWVLPCSISYSMQMEETICLTGMLLGMNHGCITTYPNQSMLQCNGNIPLHLQPSLRLCHQLGRLCLPCFGILGEYVSPFSEAWWKCEFWIVLWSSVEALGCNSEKTFRSTGKRDTASSWQCQTPYKMSNPGED
jgi:hypothetical protein